MATMASASRRLRRRPCRQGVRISGGVQPESKKVVLEQLEKKLQPGALKVEVCQVSATMSRCQRGKPCQVHTCAHGSVEKPPSDLPGRPWDQDGIQAAPLGLLPLNRRKEVLPLSVRAGHKVGEMECVEYECGQLMSRHGSDMNWLQVTQPAWGVQQQLLQKVVSHVMGNGNQKQALCLCKMGPADD